METLLSALGVPYETVDLADAESNPGDGSLPLVVGSLKDPLLERLAKLSGVAAIEDGDAGVLGWKPGDLVGRGLRPHPNPLPEGEGIVEPSPGAVLRDESPKAEGGDASPLSLWERDRVRASTTPSNASSGAGSASALPTRRRFEIKAQPRDGGFLVKLEGDLVGQVFSMLSRQEEYQIQERDEFDRFQWAHTSIQPADAAVRPTASEYAHLLLAALKQAAICSGLPVIQKEFWPHGKPMAACLTHDIDVVRRGKLPRGVAVRDVKRVLTQAAHGRLKQARTQLATIARTASSGQDPYWTFDRIAEIEERHGYRSTYFAMSRHLHEEDAIYDLTREPIKGLLAALERKGCEVSLHGSYASYSSAEALLDQKQRLEKALGRRVRGHRNHFLRFRTPESWEAQEAIGVSYDASLGYADREGFRAGYAFPFRPYDLSLDRRLDLVEIPLNVMDITLLKYRKLRGDDQRKAVEEVLEQALAVKGLATLLWHNDTFYDPDYPGSSALYESTLDWLDSHGVHVATCDEIDRWWRAREAVEVTPLKDGRHGWHIESPAPVEGLVLRLWLPDPDATPKLSVNLPVTPRSEGTDLLLEFGSLAAGTSFDLEY